MWAANVDPLTVPPLQSQGLVEFETPSSHKEPKGTRGGGLGWTEESKSQSTTLISL